ncbi:MAG: hypothetical protein IT512_10910 [Rhodocyclaceae bacterium]|nr:hypothetical protein [Rhodocyclaceae bacterium]
MTEENNQASSDDAAGKAARKKGAIKGALVGAGFALLTAAGGFATSGEVTGALKVLLSSLLVWVPICALIGWHYRMMVRLEQMRGEFKWSRTAMLGGFLGAMFFLDITAHDFSLSALSGTDWLVVLAGLVISAFMWAVIFAAIDRWLLNPPARRKKIFRFLGWSLGAVVGLYLVVLAINIPDEDLLPEAKKVLESRGFTVKEEDNAYFAIAGFNAPKGEDPHAFGRKLVAMWEAGDKKPKKERNFAEKEKALHGGEARSVKFPDDLRTYCNWAEGPCLARLAQSRDSVARFVSENPDWLERYRDLLNRPAFEEYLPVHADTPLPPYYEVSVLSRVRKSQCAVLVGDGRTGECLALLAEDVRLARRMLAGARTVFGKLSATTLLRDNYRLLGEIVAAQPEAARRQAGLIGEMLAPLTPQEKDMTAPMNAEFLYLPGILSDLRGGNFAAYAFSVYNPRFIEELVAIPLLPLLNPNASINTEYRRWVMRAEHARLPAEKFLSGQSAQEKQEAALLPAAYSPAWLYNPLGKMFIAAHLPSARDFVLRLHDLDGRQRLLRLQWKIVEQKVPADKVGDFIAAAGAEYHDPYTNKPMAWDAQKRTLTFIDRHEEWNKSGVKMGLWYVVGI